MRSRSLVWLRRLALGVVALCVGLAVAGLWCAKTESGRSFVARRVERLVTANIPGRISLGKITYIGWGGYIEAQELRFYHPDGRVVLRVKEAEVDLELADALNGRLSFEHAVAHGGYMLMSIDPDDRLSFEAAVDAPPKPGEPNVPTSGLHYAMRNMKAENFELMLRFGSFEFRLLDVNGLVTVQRIDTPGTQVLLAGFRGRVQQEIAGAHVSIKKLDGTITGKAKHVADVKATLHVGDGDLSAHLDYFDRSKEKVKLRVLKKDGVEHTTVTWLMQALASFSSDLSVES